MTGLSLSCRIREMFQADWLMKGFLAPMCSAERRCQVGGGRVDFALNSLVRATLGLKLPLLKRALKNL